MRGRRGPDDSARADAAAVQPELLEVGARKGNESGAQEGKWKRKGWAREERNKYPKGSKFICGRMRADVQAVCNIVHI